MAGLPVVDVSALRTAGAARDEVARQLDAACRDVGFFYVVGHAVDDGLLGRLEALSREFFGLPEDEKARIAMAGGGRAWRGWFPVGGELTSGRPDRKEGIYFGAELGRDHPRVAAGVPLHGPNLFPTRPLGLRDAVLGYMAAMTELGQLLASAIARGLGLPDDWFAAHLTADPTVLFRIFHYPAAPDACGGDGSAPERVWGVAEHTDYGLLTILRQDDTGGLEVRTPTGWIDAPPVPGSFVCNLGDMLERMTGGLYRSTPHRVHNAGRVGRVSFAFFFDPSWDAEVSPLPLGPPPAPAPTAPRWDGASVHALSGTYGDYLLAKVAKVFPDLGARVLDR
ncbi:MAG TPA: 2-oxoglutarate and iron-dependent oxygenase domain-containing protein [Acidimicrobiales bacterium]|nr:2-oxoglutarate and iron-dependent oxygenase domain-containing protein [Acidimicrobiales bacterium]